MTIAVVIPALDEAEEIAGAIESAYAPGAAPAGRGAAREVSDPPEDELHLAPCADDSAPPSGRANSRVEVVVVDGGSADETVARAAAAGARILSAPRGRALQLQAGVEATSADVVVFLHADTRLPRGWREAVRGALADPDVAGGAFRFRMDGGGLARRLVEWGVGLRVALFALPYGDQALFVRRGVLDAIGGVPPVPLMEDLDLVRAIQRRGRLALLDLPVTTSGRRYREGGFLRTMAIHSFAAVAWRLGIDRARVASWVRR